MKKKLLTLLFFIFSLLLFAQTPNWQWAVQAGGSDPDHGYAIVIDENENSYITGYFNGTATFGSYTLTSSGPHDIFVAKLDLDGNWLWVAQAGGGAGGGAGRGIALDNYGNCYITGSFYELATFGSYSLTNSGSDDIFVAKLDVYGNWLWATQAGGIDMDGGRSIEIDNYGNSYITGCFNELATFGSYSLTSCGPYDIFVAKLDTNGNWLWVSQAGGSDIDGGYAIGIDNNGNSYITGCFNELATFGSYSLTSSGNFDIFVAKLDTNGNWLWATQAGGINMDGSKSIAIDDEGNSYITGYFLGLATFGSYSLTSSSEFDIFAAKLDTNGNWLWATQTGGNASEISYGIGINSNGYCYITGFFVDIVTFGAYTLTSSGSYDIFVAMLDVTGNWVWAIQSGGNGLDEGSAIVIDNNGNSYVTGHFSEIAYFGPYSLSSNGSVDIFIAKLGNDTSIGNETITTSIVLSNFPNPFNPSTEIKFQISGFNEIETAEIIIYNLKGQKIKTFPINPSTHQQINSITWNGDDDNGKLVSSGVYFYKLYVNDKTVSVKKCLLLK